MTIPAVQTLALLVGSNPLPNYLAAATLRSPSIFLLHSPDTERIAQRLAQTIRESFGSNVSLRCIQNPTDARQVQQAWGGLPPNTHLNYTGGTKIMSAHALASFLRSGGVASNASYVDDGVLLFDDGHQAPLETDKLNVPTVLELHDVEQAPSTPCADEPSDADARYVAQMTFEQPKIAITLYERFQLGSTMVQFDDLLPRFRITSYPQAGWNKRTAEKWRRFLKGTWLDVWVADQVRGLTASKVECGLNLSRYGRPLEIDALTTIGHRLYAVSCTTDSTLGTCKLKLFEIALRSRQIGGDLARSALVCFLDGSDSNGVRVGQVQSDLASIWDAPNVPRVFGLAHLREWMGTGGMTPHLASLNEWLTT
jgi:hypothetical protein